MACPHKYNKVARQRKSIRQIFEYDNNGKELQLLYQEMQKTALWESKSLIRKVLSSLLT